MPKNLMPKNSERISAAGAPRHSGSRCLLALVTPLLWPSSSVLYTELAPQQSTTTARTNCSTVLHHQTGPGKVHGGAGGGGSGGRNEGAPVGDSPPFVPVSQSRLHRRCAHRGARGRERRRLLFRPGALFTPEGTAKYISLHLSYRRPGVQPPPVRLSSTLAPAK